jgi:hypothetical protein
VTASVVVVEAEDRQLGALARSAGLSVVSAAELGSLETGKSVPDVLVVDLRGQSGFPPELAAFKRRHPRTGVVIVVLQLEPRHHAGRHACRCYGGLAGPGVAC